MSLSLKPAFLIAFTLLLVLSSSLVPSARAETQPTVQLTSLDYPHAVAPGTALQLTVNAQYSDKFLSDVGIWDVDTGLMVQSMTFISQFMGPGNVSFSLPLTAPKTIGPWHLLVLNRVWWQNAWYQDPKGSEEPFTITVTNNITLALGSIGADAQISVDGPSYEVKNESTVSVVLQPGAHVLDAPGIIEQNANERYVFEGWSDGVDSNPQTLHLTESATIYALYQAEYYLSAQTNMGQITGTGWYPKGAQATVGVAPTVWIPSSLGSTDEYRFSGWSGDSNLTANVVVLNMDGPKEVSANWTNVGPVIGSNFLTLLLVLCCLPMLGRFLYVRYRGGRRTRLAGNLLSPTAWVLMCLLLTLLISPLVFPMVQAQALPNPRASIVKIGDAEWYYWNQPGSDTCLLWLGGGVPEEAEPGSYGYFINPFDYESFGTIRFIQDLANFYCVVALQHGSVEGFNPTANRTIYQELVQPQTSTLEDVHKWILGQGYVHTFVVGYSVGGQAAASDLTLSHPQDWSSQDGIILITVPFSQDVLKNAKELRTNLFVIYGGNLPDYEATGLSFYNDTQPEGLHGTQSIHKEFHVIDDAGHEVWTIRASGAYDTRALNLIVGFVEVSKRLQIGQGQTPGLNNSTVTARIIAVRVPPKVGVGEPFIIKCNVSATFSSSEPEVLAAYETNHGQLLSQTELTNSNRRVVQVIIPPIPNNTILPLNLVILQATNGGWVQVSNEYSTQVLVTNFSALIIETSYPDIGFSFDGTQYTTNSTGFMAIQTTLGQHFIQIQPFIYLSNTSRLRFVGWEDFTNATSRQIQLAGDSTINIAYVQQYLLQVSSPYGQASGSGWYDTNSSATALVQPAVLNSPPVIFSHWATDQNLSQASALVRVTAPQMVSAVWSPTTTGSESTPIYGDPLFLLSLLAFMFLLGVNLKARSTKRGR
jgi:hypothetical protein